MANRKWTREEAIVLFDFYRTHSHSLPSQNSAEIHELSNTLRKLNTISGGDVSGTFRNPSGVYMQMMGFHFLNPEFPGKGLSNAASKLFTEIFHEFNVNQTGLAHLSNVIVKFMDIEKELPPADAEDQIGGQKEGRHITRIHKFYERKPGLVKMKKELVLDTKGSLDCEACGFDFQKKYGGRGEKFIECHHTIPVSEMPDGQETKLDDLRLVCSNCHRMVHRKRPWLSMEQLTKTLCG